jgi:hypothetical protein
MIHGGNMKQILFVLAALLALSCAPDSRTSIPNDCACAKNPTIMSFRTDQGYKNVSWDKIVSLTVSMFATPADTTPTLTKTFTGKEAVWVVSHFSLFNPKESAVTSSLSTGGITLRYWDDEENGERSHLFTIENNRLIQDYKFRGVNYQPTAVLDLEWLKKQPEIPQD